MTPGPEVGHGDCVDSWVGALTVPSEAKAQRKRGFLSVMCLSLSVMCLPILLGGSPHTGSGCVWPIAVAKGPRDAPTIPRHLSDGHPRCLLTSFWVRP